MDNQSLRKICALLLVAFGSVGVLHSLYSKHWSGTTEANIDFQKLFYSSPPESVVIISDWKRKGGPLQLTPEMSPLRAVLHVTYIPQTMATPIRYSVSMESDQHQELWTDEGTASGTEHRWSLDNKAIPLRDFNITSDGAYLFTVGFNLPYQSLIQSAHLEIRKNVSGINRGLVGFCIIGVVLSFIGLLKSTPSNQILNVD